jgi:hypothetical protein
MKPQDKQAESAEPKPKAPYQRPELKRAGTLRDVTAQATGMDEDLP